MADKVVSKKFVPMFDWSKPKDEVKTFVIKTQAEIVRSLKGEAEVEAKMCAHSSQEGVGTKKTGYAKAENGPFCCINCEHVSEGGTRCDHTDVVIDPEVKKDGMLAIVQPLACCNYYRPKGNE